MVTFSQLAIKINPNDAALLHMLGEWCYQVSEVPWHQRKAAQMLYTSLPNSTYEDALDYFLKAEAAQPRFYSVNLLRLGCCYLKLNKEDQAKYYLKLAASYPAKSNDDHLAKKEAADILRTLKVKADFYLLIWKSFFFLIKFLKRKQPNFWRNLKWGQILLYFF